VRTASMIQASPIEARSVGAAVGEGGTPRCGARVRVAARVEASLAPRPRPPGDARPGGKSAHLTKSLPRAHSVGTASADPV
jgi:hypothetical protein